MGILKLRKEYPKNKINNAAKNDGNGVSFLNFMANKEKSQEFTTEKSGKEEEKSRENSRKRNKFN